MHGDHIYGLPGLLATLGLSGNSNGIEIYGPSELRSFVISALKNSYCKLSFPLTFIEVEDFALLNKVLFENNKVEVVDEDTILEISTFVAKGQSYEASEGNHDDLMMNFIMFGYFSGTNYFSEVTDINIKKLMFEQRMKEIEDDVLPFGF